MFAVKIFNKKEDRTKNFNKTISNIANFIKTTLSEQLSVISDSSSFEIVSGSSEIQDGDIVTELLIKKTIILKKEDFEDRVKLDKYIKDIKNFCTQASHIKNNKYYPINYKEIK